MVEAFNFMKGFSTAGLADNLVFYIAIIFGLVAIIGVLMLILYIKSFKDTFVIKELVNNRKRVIHTKCREKIIDGVTYIEIFDKKKLKGKDIIEVPDPVCVEVTEKGKKYIEAYRDQYNNYYYIKDPNQFMTPPKDLFVLDDYSLNKELESKIIEQCTHKGVLDKKKFEAVSIAYKLKLRDSTIADWMEKNNAISPIKPFTTNQKIAQVNLFKRKLELKGKGFKELIKDAIYFGSVIIIIGVLVFGYSEFAEPKERVKAMELKINEEQTKQLELLKELKNDIQILKENSNSGGVGVAPN